MNTRRRLNRHQSGYFVHTGILLLILFCFAFFSPPLSAQGKSDVVIQEFTGDVLTMKPDGISVAPKNGLELSMDDVIRTSAGSTCLLKHINGNTYLVCENSNIKVFDIIDEMVSKDEFVDKVKVADVSGRVQMKKSSQEDWTDIVGGERLSSGDTIRTLFASGAVLAYPDKTTLTLSENSVLEIRDISRNPKTGVEKRELKLNLGNLKYRVTPLEHKASEFKIHSSTAIVGITGTEGVVSTGGEGKPTSNILIEGSTYNSDVYGRSMKQLTAGNTIVFDKNSKSDKHRITEKENKASVTDPEKEICAEKVEEFMVKYQQKRDTGVDVSNLSDLAKQIEDMYLSSRFADCELLIEQGLSMIDAVSEMPDPKRVALMKDISDLQTLLASKEVKADIKEVSKLYVQIENMKTACQEKNYQKAAEMLKRAKMKVQLLQEVPENNNSFETELDKVEIALLMKNKKGFIVDEARDYIGRAQMMFNSNNIPKAWLYMNKAKELLSISKYDKPADIEARIARLSEAVQTARDNQMDVECVSELLRKIKKAHHDGLYLEAQLVLEDAEAKVNNLSKIVPPDIKYKYESTNALLTDLFQKGYDVSTLEKKMSEEIKVMLADGRFEDAKSALSEITASTENLSVPSEFQFRRNYYKKVMANKEAAGNNMKEYQDILHEIELLLEAQKLQKANLLLTQAIENIQNEKDTVMPTVQVGDLEYGQESVTVHGLVKDNAKASYVTVNGNMIPVDESGAFSKQFKLTKSMKKLVVEAVDASGNRSPKLEIAIDEEKRMQSAEAPHDPVSPKDFKAKFSNGILFINAKLTPSKVIFVDSERIVVPADGILSLRMTPKQSFVEKGLEMSVADSEGNPAKPVMIPIADEDGPEIKIKRVRIVDQSPPDLSLDEIDFSRSGYARISGKVRDISNIQIIGAMKDFSSIDEVKVGDNQFTLNESNEFTINMTVNDDLLKKGVLKITAKDVKGNISEHDIELNMVLSSGILNINNENVYVNENGEFSEDMLLTSSLKSLLVCAKDLKGNSTSVQEIILPDRVAPKVKLGDLQYTKTDVLISGMTEPGARVIVGESDEVIADGAGLFEKRVMRPSEPTQISVKAVDSSANTSESVFVALKPTVDSFAPILMLSELEYKNGKVLVKGYVDDDVKVERVTINDVDTEFDKQGYFESKINITESVTSFTVIAYDKTGKFSKVIKAMKDTNSPELKVQPLSYSNGVIVVRGNAKDDVALREVRVNKMPVEISKPMGGDFEYRAVLTASLKEVVVEAIDSFGNLTKVGPMAVQPPQDKGTPNLMADNLKFGSPQIIVTGVISDDVGISNVKINGDPITVYDDGSYKAVVPLKVASPAIVLDALEYQDGVVTVGGQVTLGAISPSVIVITGEDLSGNEAPAITRPIDTSSLDEIRVFINGEPVPVSSGRFNVGIPLSGGLKKIEVTAIDPFDVAGGPVFAELETEPPSLELEDLEYEDDLVIVKGRASDEGSGVAYVEINGVKLDAEDDGSFEKELMNQVSNIRVLAYDRVGNVAEAPILTVTPPDVYPPFFEIKVTPVPAFTGSDANIIVDAYDEGFTDKSDVLAESPEVMITYSDGSSEEVILSGEESHFEGVLHIGEDVAAGIASIAISGKDIEGNEGERIEGMDSFMINSSDDVAPTFSVAISPEPPAIIGSQYTVNITSSESLQDIPSAVLIYADGSQDDLQLSGSEQSLAFTSAVNISETAMPGTANITISGGVDLAGNQQTDDVVYQFEVIPPSIDTKLLFEVNMYEFASGKLMLKGITDPGSIVKASFDTVEAEVFSDDAGGFEMVHEFTAEDIKALLKKAKTIKVTAYATNYAGLKSDETVLFIDIPALKEETKSKKSLAASINPKIVQQGKQAQIQVTASKRLALPPEVSVRLVDGTVVPVEVAGRGKLFNAVFTAKTEHVPGPAMLEVKSGELLSTYMFEITPSTELLARTLGANIYTVTADPDPAIIGKEGNITVRSSSPINWVPTAKIEYAGGQIDVPLAGSQSEFTGVFRVPENAIAGPAKIVVDEGKSTASTRPFSIDHEHMQGDMDVDVMLWTEPTPMTSGSKARVMMNANKALSFVPTGFIQFSDGRRLDFGFSGAVGSMRFTSEVDIPQDAAVGIVFVRVLDNKSAVIGETTSGVVPNMAGMGAMGDINVDAFTVPEPMTLGMMARVMVNSDKPLDFIPKAKLILSDMRSISVPLTGVVGSTHFEGAFEIPGDAKPGPVGIEVKDDKGNLIGGGGSYIEEYNYREDRELYILINPPQVAPGDNMEINVTANRAINFLPKAVMRYGDGSSTEVRLSEVERGLMFKGVLKIKQGAIIPGAMVEVYDDKGIMAASMSVAERYTGTSAYGYENIEMIVSPEPPMPGNDMRISLKTPRTVTKAPMVFARFYDGSSRKLNVTGALPGDRFEAFLSASQFKSSLMGIDVEKPDGTLLITRPYGMAAMQEPFNLFASPEGPNTIKLQWNMLSTAMRYVVEYRKTDSGYQKLEVGNIDNHTLTGLVGGSTYFIQVRALDGKGSEVALTPEMMASTMYDAGGTVGDIYIMPEPAMPGMSVEIGINVPQPMYVPPKLDIWFKNGTSMNVYSGGGPYHFEAYIPPIPDYIDRIEVVDANSGRVLFSRYFDTASYASMGYQGAPPVVYVTPDPPVAGVDMTARVEFSQPVYFIPNVSVQMKDGNEIYQPMSGNYGDMSFTFYLSGSQIQSDVHMIEVEDETGMILESMIFVGQDEATAEIQIDPYPAQMYMPLYISVNFDKQVSYSPKIEVEFTDGTSTLIQATGAVPGYSFRGMLDGSVFNKAIELLDVLDDKGMIVGTMSMQGAMMDTSGGYTGSQGTIGTMPDMPAPNASLTVYLDVVYPMYQMPKMLIWYTNGSSQEAYPSGGPNHFEAQIGAIKDYVDRIEVYDNTTGTMLFQRVFDSAAQSTYYGAPPSFTVNPDPPVSGNDVHVQVDFPQNVYFIPELFMRFSDGHEMYQMMNGNMGGMSFYYDLPMSQNYSDMTIIELRDASGMVIDSRNFSYSSGAVNANIMVEPYPPQMNTPLNIKVEFNQSVNYAPHIRVEFEDGSFIGMGGSGAYPGNVFTGMLDAANFNRSIRMIEVFDMNGVSVANLMLTGTTTNTMTTALQGTVMLNPSPAYPNDYVQVILDISQPMYSMPKLQVWYIDQTSEMVYPGGGPYHFEGSIPLARNYIDRVDVIDTQTGIVAFTQYFDSSSIGTYTGAMPTLDVAPPVPQTNMPLAINLNFPKPVYFIPNVRIVFADGHEMNNVMSGNMGDMYFGYNLAAGEHYSQVSMVEVTDNTGMQLGTLNLADSAASGSSQGTIGTMPDPPEEGSALTVYVDMMDYTTQAPRLSVWFANGSMRDVYPSGGPHHFEANVGVIYNSVERIEAWNQSTGVLMFTRHFDISQSGAYTGGAPTMAVNPYNPAPRTDVFIEANFPQSVYFIPEVVIRDEAGGEAYYAMSGNMGDMYFSYNLTASQNVSRIKEVEIRDQNGTPLATQYFDEDAVASGGSITLSNETAVPGDPMMIYVYTDQYLTDAPKLYVIFESEPSRELYTYGDGHNFQSNMGAMPDYITRIEVMDKNSGAVLLSRDLSMAPADSGAPTIVLTPENPAPYEYVRIEAQFSAPVYFTPEISVYFQNGGNIYMRMNGQSGSNMFYYDLTSAQNTSYISRIEIRNPNTGMIASRDFAGYVSPTDGTISMSPADPVINDYVRIMVDVNSPMYQAPRLRIFFEQQASQEIDTTGTEYHFEGEIQALPGYITRIEVIDTYNYAMLFGTDFNTSGSQKSGTLVINPDPPELYTNFNIQFTSDVPLTTAPRLEIEYYDGFESYIMDGAAYQTYFTYNIPYLSRLIQEIRIVDDYTGMMFSGGEMFLDMLHNLDIGEAEIVTEPAEPVVGQSLRVIAQFADSVPLDVVAEIGLKNGGGEYRLLCSDENDRKTFKCDLAASMFTQPLEIIEIQSMEGDFLGQRIFTDNEAGVAQIFTSPEVPEKDQSLEITIQFENPAPFIPTVIVEYVDETEEEMIATGAVGDTQFYASVGSLTNYVELIDVEDDTGSIVGSLNFDSSQYADADYEMQGSPMTVSPPNPEVGDSLFVEVDLSFLIAEPIKIFVVYVDGDEDEIIMTGATGEWSSHFTGSMDEVTKAIQEIQLRHPQTGEIKDVYVVGMTDVTANAPTGFTVYTGGTSGEVTMSWDRIDGASGYKIYYGENPGDYSGDKSGNGDSSPLWIHDGYQTYFDLHNLADGQTYYFAVTAFDANYNESPYSEELSAIPSSSGGTSNAGDVLNIWETWLDAGMYSAGMQASVQFTIENTSYANFENIRQDGSVELYNQEGDSYSIQGSSIYFSPVPPYYLSQGTNQYVNMYIDIPSDAPDGLYSGQVRFGNDSDNNGYIDSGEPYDYVDIQLRVGEITGTLTVSPEQPVPYNNASVSFNADSSMNSRPRMRLTILGDGYSNEYDMMGTTPGTYFDYSFVPSGYVRLIEILDTNTWNVMATRQFELPLVNNVQAQATGSAGEVRVTWNYVQGAPAYRVKWVDENSNEGEMDVVGGNTEAYIYGLNPGVNYGFKVAVLEGNYAGAPSGAYSDTSYAIPASGAGTSDIIIPMDSLDMGIREAGTSSGNYYFRVDNNASYSLSPVLYQLDGSLMSGEGDSMNDVFIGAYDSIPYGGSVQVKVIVNIPSDQPDGIYTGTLRVFADSYDQDGSYDSGYESFDTIMLSIEVGSSSGSGATIAFTDNTGAAKSTFNIYDSDIYVTVTDASKNQDSTRSEYININLQSVYTGDICEFILNETDMDSGVFRNTAGFESTAEYSGNYTSNLYVVDNSAIEAWYEGNAASATMVLNTGGGPITVDFTDVSGNARSSYEIVNDYIYVTVSDSSANQDGGITEYIYCDVLAVNTVDQVGSIQLQETLPNSGVFRNVSGIETTNNSEQNYSENLYVTDGDTVKAQYQGYEGEATVNMPYSALSIDETSVYLGSVAENTQGTYFAVTVNNADNVDKTNMMWDLNNGMITGPGTALGTEALLVESYSVAAQSNSVWQVKANIPSGQMAGTYSGTFRVFCDNNGSSSFNVGDDYALVSISVDVIETAVEGEKLTILSDPLNMGTQQQNTNTGNYYFEIQNQAGYDFNDVSYQIMQPFEITGGGDAIPIGNMHVNEDYTSIPSGSSYQWSINVDVPENISNGTYLAQIKIYNDEHNTGVHDADEPYDIFTIQLTVGVTPGTDLNIIETTVDMGANQSNDMTGYSYFNVYNNSGADMSNLTAVVEAIFLSGGGSIPIGNVELSVPSSASDGQTVQGQIRVDIPEGQAEGAYQATVKVYDDNGDQPYDTVDISLSVVAPPGGDLAVTSGSINMGQCEQNNSSSTYNFTVQNNSVSNMYAVKVQLLTPFASGGDTIPAGAITLTVPANLSSGSSVDGSIQIDIGSEQATGTYNGQLLVFNDGVTWNDVLEAWEPYDIVDVTIEVISSGTSATVYFANSTGSPRSDYTIGLSTIFVKVVDTDEDESPSPEQVQVTVSDPTTGDSVILWLDETGDETGEFINVAGLETVVSATASSGDNVLQTEHGHTIYVDYTDNDDGSDTAQNTAQVEQAGAGQVITTAGEVSFINSGGSEVGSYTADVDSIFIRVTDDDANTDDGLPESFSVQLVNASNGDSMQVTLYETAMDSGVFVNTTGIPVVQGTVDSGNAILEVTGEDVIEVSYTDPSDGSDNDHDTASIGLQPSVGNTVSEIEFSNSSGGLESSYTIGAAPVYITVYDADENITTTAKESVWVTVTNLNNSDYVDIQLSETGVNSGVFRNTVGIPTAGGTVTADALLQAADGDTIQVGYIDPNDPGDTSQVDAIVVGGFGDGDLLISQSLLEFGEVSVDNNTGSVKFDYSNSSSTSDFSHVKFIKNELSDGQGNYIDASNVNVLDVDSSLAMSSGSSGSVTIFIPGATVAGEYSGEVKLYEDVNNDDICDAGEPYDVMMLEVTVVNAIDLPPTFRGVDAATATSTYGEIALSWEKASDDNTAAGSINYKIYYGTSISGMSLMDTQTDIDSYVVSGLSENQTYFFKVQAEDSLYQVDGNEKIVSAVPASSGVDRIDIKMNSEGKVGEAELVRLEAVDTNGDVVTTFNASVEIRVIEPDGRDANSFFLSNKDRVSDAVYNVETYKGVGYFTIDDLEAEELEIDVVNFTQDPDPAIILFTPAQSGTSLNQFVLEVDKFVTSYTGATTKVPVVITAVDDTGRVIDDYAGEVDVVIVSGDSGTVTWSVMEGGGSLNGNRYTFVPADKGDAVLELRDTYVGGQSLSIQVQGVTDSGIYSNIKSVTSRNVARYALESRGRRDLVENVTTGGRIKFFAYAVDSSDNELSGYNGQAEGVIQSETVSQSGNFTSRVSPSTIDFSDGVAEFYVEDSEYETVEILLSEVGGTGVNSGTSPYVSVRFQSTDTEPPRILKARAESPYLVRVFFSEVMDQSTVLDMDNYSVDGQSPHTVCWYGDQMTIHLDTAMIAANSPQLTVQGEGPAEGGSDTDLKDENGNYIGNDAVVEIDDVPESDYLGGPIQGSDFFEIQMSGTHVIIYHKNACGYLSGTNAVNRKTDVTSANINYTGGLSGPSHVALNDGVAEFDVEITGSGAITVEASEDSSVNGTYVCPCD